MYIQCSVSILAPHRCVSHIGVSSPYFSIKPKSHAKIGSIFTLSTFITLLRFGIFRSYTKEALSNTAFQPLALGN